MPNFEGELSMSGTGMGGSGAGTQIEGRTTPFEN